MARRRDAADLRPDRPRVHRHAAAGLPHRSGHRRGARRRPHARQHRCGGRRLRADDRRVVAVEPSRTMIAQRPSHAAPCIQGVAERLPFRDRSVDASLAILTIHHWTDQAAGLRELRRVARRRVVVLTWDPRPRDFWLTAEYFPEILDLDRPAVRAGRGAGATPRDDPRDPRPDPARLPGWIPRRVLAPAGGLPRPGRPRRHLVCSHRSRQSTLRGDCCASPTISSQGSWQARHGAPPQAREPRPRLPARGRRAGLARQRRRAPGS